jgi:hydroxyacylglutathione hydrolase
MGRVEIEIITTPGHSPDSVCLYLSESGTPVALFSGDTLFAGDVGRPDLRDLEVGARELAAVLYESLFHKLLRLPPKIRVYPAHGAGSLCGRQISSEPFTTIGQEAETNWALQLKDRARLVEAMVANLPERPPYFARSVAINLRGAPFLSDRPAVAHLPMAQQRKNGVRAIWKGRFIFRCRSCSGASENCPERCLWPSYARADTAARLRPVYLNRKDSSA